MFENLYDNISDKIKKLACICFILSSITCVILGFILLSEGFKYDSLRILFGFLILFIGPIVSWASSFLIYGFGELIEKTTTIEWSIRQSASAKNSQRAPTIPSEGSVQATNNVSNQVEAHNDTSTPPPKVQNRTHSSATPEHTFKTYDTPIPVISPSNAEKKYRICDICKAKTEKTHFIKWTNENTTFYRNVCTDCFNKQNHQ